MSIIKNIDSRFGIISLLITIIGSCCSAVYGQSLIINEIMQSNIDCLLFEHDYPDSWVELFNPTEKGINLNGFSLGEKIDHRKAYRFDSSLVIPSKGYIIISCDKIGKGLHSKFRLSPSADELFLFNASGKLIDRVEYPQMLAPNIAYGRESDGHSKWGWELVSTPGRSNTGGLSTILLPNPEFNRKGQVLDKPVKVSITIPQGDYPLDTRIFITTDGSEPTKNSASFETWTAEIKQNTVIRAKLMSERALSPRSTTQSYIFHPRKTTLPIISIVTDSSHFYSDENGILSSHRNEEGIANYSFKWRRPINIEYLGHKGEAPLFNQLAETAVGGYGSRPYEEKSLKVYTKKRFGKKSFKGQLWEDKPNVQKVQSFVLRNGGSSAKRARINDGFVQRLFGRHLQNVDYQSYSAAIVYINGSYYGELALRERTDEDFIEANYKDVKDYVIEDHRAYLEDSIRGPLFQKFYDLYHEERTTYEQMEAVMDVDNFMKALIAELFASNYDFPANNVIMWRSSEKAGRWRWILKDLDWLALYYEEVPANYNTFKFLFGAATPEDLEFREASRPTVQQASVIYRKMMSFPQFREAFIDAFSTYLGDFLKPSVTIPLIDEMHNEIAEELKATWATYGWTTSLSVPVDSLRAHCRARHRILYQQMAEFFGLGTVIPMQIVTKDCDVLINGVGLTEGDFDGYYYSDRPLCVNTNRPKYGWAMKTYDNKGKVLQQQAFDTAVVELKLADYPNCAKVSFTPYELTTDPFAEDTNWWQAYWYWVVCGLLILVGAVTLISKGKRA